MTDYKVHFFRYSAVDDDFDGSKIVIFVRSYQTVFKLQYHSHVYTGQRLAFYQRCLQLLREHHDDETEQDTINTLVAPFKPWMDNMALAPPTTTLLLHDYLYVATYVFNAVADTTTPDAFKPVSKGPIFGRAYPARGLEITTTHHASLTWCPLFTSKQVQLPEAEPEAGYFACLESPNKVLVGNTICNLKQFGAYEVEHEAKTAEFDAYRKIAQARARGTLPATFRIARLHGLVVDDRACIPRAMMAPRGKDKDRHYRLIGMLIEHIDHRCTLWDAARQASCTNEQRRTWAGELGAMVTQLHEAGIVWGDVKPRNVLVDAKNQLWIVDFAGGYTPKWVDYVHKGTMAGDMQGVERIQSWLFRREK